jgi:RNA polymerase sigma-70 factor (ECF subfamily)
MLTTIDTNTILGAQGGRPEQVTALYEHYHAGIFRYLYYRVGDRQTAEDLTSEVFLRMIRNLAGYRLQGSSAPFQAWLFQIAHNLATDHFRRSSIHPQVTLAENLAAADPEPDAGVEHRLTHEHLRQALARLNEDQRDVVLMRFVVGLPIVEVAQTLRKSEDAVKGLQRRGLSALRDGLSELEASYV